ncbi:MAG TPA: Bax inhibitor-1 family protein [Gemmatales bacterium]|nr:Bax inhibitor-1 family protein [Gemmatales bacterium]
MYEADMNWEQRVAADAALSERVTFIRRTYLHVSGALVALTIMLAALVNFVPDEVLRSVFGRGGSMGMLIILGLFWAVSFAARSMAQANKPIGMQYAGLALYTGMMAFMLWPAIWLSTNVAAYNGILGQAVILTLALAAGLTVSVFVTKVDFSFLRSFIVVSMFIAMGLIVASILFKFDLGLLFSLAMVVLLSLCILYSTSNIMKHYPTNAYVAAALEIFSTVVVLFSYILNILMRGRD